MPVRGRVSLRVSERLYGGLLVLYPKEFRDAYGQQMMQVFRDECREAIGRAGVVGLAGLWARTFLDLCFTALAERSNMERSPVGTIAIYPSLARLGGAAAVLGGVLSFLVNARKLIPFFFEGRRPLAEAGLGPLVSLLSFLSTFASTLLFVVALTCLYALLGRRSTLGLFGLGLAYLSIPASVLPVVPGRGLLLGLGVLLLGLAALGARLLGRWRALPTSLGALIIAVSVVYGPLGRLIGIPPLTAALGQSLGVPVGLPMVFPGLCWVLLGVAMWAYAPRGERVAETRSTPSAPSSS